MPTEKKKTFDDDQSMSVPHFAKKMDLSDKTVRREIWKGNLRAVKLKGGRDWRILGADANAWIAEMESNVE